MTRITNELVEEIKRKACWPLLEGHVIDLQIIRNIVREDITKEEMDFVLKSITKNIYEPPLPNPEPS